MNITVIGCGRWGSFIAWYLDRLGYNIKLYGRETSEKLERFRQTRTNDLLTLGERVKLTSDFSEALSSDIIVISVNSQGLRDLMKQISAVGVYDKTFVLCMKGLEIGSGKRLSEIAEEYVDESNKIAVWLGPGHVQEFVNETPNCMVIDSKDEAAKRFLVSMFSSNLIRFYYGNDLIGNEIGAASKNVVGIAAGALDGLNLSSLKGALMSRATREIAVLIKAMGGNELSAYGLCHLGDYEATVFSQFSHNRKFGEMYVKGEHFLRLAEGYYTVQALMRMSKEVHTEIPICEAVFEVLYNKKDVREALNELFLRSIKPEF